MANREGKATESDEVQRLLGATINGRYKVLSLIARGGMGKVYRAEQSALGRVCALKVLSPHHEGDKDPEFHKRFSLEASTAARLQHANTVTIFDYGKCELHGVYYIAMEYLDGRTLHRVLHDERALAEARAGHIAQQVCRSLHEAHRIGVVHRDLKPSNILLVERGDEPDFVKVLDFGLVKDVTGRGEDLTQTGLFMGSPKYMAPEQVLGTEISPRTDVYALGVILYEMITGKVPFDRKGGMSTLVAHVNEAPPPLGVKNPDAVVSPEMEAIVMRCLAKEPGDRFASMKDLLAHLKRATGDLSDTYESLPRPSLDYDTAMGRGKRGEPPPSRLSTPPPSISGTLRSAVSLSGARERPPTTPPAPSYNIVAPQTETGSGPQPPYAPPESGPGPSYAPPESSPRPVSAGPSQPAPSLGRPSGRPPPPDDDPSGSISRPSARPGPKSDSLAPPQASRTFTGTMVRPAAPAWRPYAVAVLASIVGGSTAAVVLSKRPDVPRPVTLASVASATPEPSAVAIAVSPSAEAPRGPDVRC
jgi:serine/threonine-protein kinase